MNEHAQFNIHYQYTNLNKYRCIVHSWIFWKKSWLLGVGLRLVFINNN